MERKDNCSLRVLPMGPVRRFGWPPACECRLDSHSISTLELITVHTFLMGHGNSNKLYVTHAEHSGLFGQHTASSSGFKAYVDTSFHCLVPHARVSPASQMALTQLPSRPSIAALFLFSHSLTLSAPVVQTGRGLFSISPTSFLG